MHGRFVGACEVRHRIGIRCYFYFDAGEALLLSGGVLLSLFSN